ncbi:hypothetical protein PR048_004817 [Dryococelus australis]|uniref:PiggyBac transposable element-derived protein domain-containing protein n=1 Tax=Dryococelus australis TaxID=614101 RepID=A0ABQ9I6Y2_9NEOP|nr:hypothetical protein PR048_004817 [Dryococelus australis]
MQHNNFDEIIQYLPIEDNAAMDGTDRMYKVRPLFDHLNSAFKQISVGKPIIFGFKLWVAADPSGYIFHVEPYCGKSTRFPTTGNGQGNYVVGLVDHLQLKKGTRLYFDNFFTFPSRLRNLKSNGIGATGTKREIDTRKLSLKNKRGHMAVSSCGDLLAVRWNDNSIVTVLTDCDEVEPKKKSSRYSRTEKKTVIVEVPGPTAKYNANMGCVDLCHQFVSTYCCGIRSKKWWLQLYAWTVDVSCVQGWLLHHKLGYDMSLLEFHRQYATNLRKTCGKPAVSPGVHPFFAFPSVLEEMRIDGVDHIITKGDSKYWRCKITFLSLLTMLQPKLQSLQHALLGTHPLLMVHSSRACGTLALYQ